MLDFLKKLTAPAPGNGTGRDGSLAKAESYDPNPRAKGLAEGADAKDLVQRRHVDFLEHQIRWRWLLDSYEGGDRYRNAVYGPDRKGLPLRNLFRHRREYPDPQQFPVIYSGFAGGLQANNATTAGVGYGPYPGMLGADAGATAEDDDYELRRARTPVPEFVAEVVELILGKVYDQEVTRNGQPELKEFWEDVDGGGTPIDDWVRDTVAPLLLVLGCLDICIDHPKAPPGEKVETRADETRLGLDKAVASYILPENLVWWRCDAAGRYTHCLVREYEDPSARVDVDKSGKTIDTQAPGRTGDAWRKNYERFRYWTPTESILYSSDGDHVFETIPHSYGRPPIVRLIDLKKHRTRNVGKSRVDAVAELQREYYNRDSELILSDTLQAHPLLSGPEDYCKADNTLSVGPGYVLPKKKHPESGTYEGWEYTSPDKDPAASLRTNKQDLIDMKDRRMCLTKPAGAHAAGHGGQGGSGPVAQSGTAKRLDADDGHKMLSSVSKSFAKAERFIGELALMVLRNRPVEKADREQIKIAYPARFQLFSAAELIDALTKMQLSARNAGQFPQTEGLAYQSIMRQLLLGLPDEDYEALDTEIETFMATKAITKEGKALPPPGITDRADTGTGPGTAERMAGEDPTGQSGGTMIGYEIPSVQ